MALFSSRSSHPALSCADGLAAGGTDLLLLVGRVLFGWIYLASGWGKLGDIAVTTGYFTNLGLSPPGFWAWFVGLAEVGIGVALIVGLATRYAAIATFILVLVATLMAHRYWTYPPAQQGAQFGHFLKNVAIMGGALYILAVGAGRYAVDAVLAKR